MAVLFGAWAVFFIAGPSPLTAVLVLASWGVVAALPLKAFIAIMRGQ